MKDSFIKRCLSLLTRETILTISTSFIIIFSAVFTATAFAPSAEAVACSCNDHCNGNAPDTQCSVHKGCNANNRNGICQQCPQAGDTQGCPNGYICRNNANGKNICVLNDPPTPTPTNTPTPTFTPTPTPIMNPPGPEQTTGLPQNGIQTVCQMPPVDVMFVVDTSRSMKGKLGDAIAAMHLFISIIAQDPRNRMALAFFDDNGRVKHEFTDSQDPNALRAVIDSLRVEDKDHLGTCLECAIDGRGGDDVFGAFNRAQTFNGMRNRRIMIILSDGQINHWINDNTGEIMNSNGDPDSQRRAREHAEGAIRRVYNTFQVETWVAHFGAQAFNWQWMQSLAANYGGGHYDWEGWYTNSTLPVGSPLQWIYYYWARDIFGGFLNIRVFDDTTRNGYACAATDGSGQCISWKPPLAGWNVTLKRYVNNIDYNNWWAHTLFPVYRTYTVPTNGIGRVKFDRMCPGAYTVYITPKPHYKFSENLAAVGPRVNPRTLLPFTALQDFIWAQPADQETQTRDFGFYRIHTVSGHLYIDRDESGTENAGDDRWPLNFTMLLSPSNGSTPTMTPPNGEYSIFNIPNGSNYTLRPLSIPGFGPKNPPSPGAYALTVNDINCTVSNATGYTCNEGDIGNLNFGIVDISEKPWIQTAGFDIRSDQQGITNHIPNGQACGVNQNLMIQNGNGNTSGILFSNGTNDFGLGTGKATSANWVVNGQRYFPGEALKTSYADLTDTLTRNKVTPRPLTDYNPCSNPATACKITSNIPDGVYRADSDLILDDVNVGNKKVVILVNGHIRVDKNTVVGANGFLMVVANRGITVARDVGRSANYLCAYTNPNITELQGIFVANGDFTVRGFGGCPTIDRQLNIGGAVVTNADAFGGGSLQNQRTLCLTNSQRPVITIRPRLSFIFSIPPSILRQSTSWQEAAP